MRIDFDFEAAEEKYPLSIALLLKWAQKDSDGYSQLGSHNGRIGFIDWQSDDDCRVTYFNPLELDFFFDERGIYGFIECSFPDYLYYIKDNKGYDVLLNLKAGNKIAFQSRSEALVAKWNRQFELLEEQLNTENSST